MNEMHQLQHKRIMMMACAALTFGCFAIWQLFMSLADGQSISDWNFNSKDAYLIICCMIIVSIVVIILIRSEQDIRQATKAELFDQPTGLPNGFYLRGRIKTALNSAQYDRGVGLLIVGVGGLTSINETHGYSVGNQVIKAVARNLNSKLDYNVLLTRVAGDKFGLLFDNIDGEPEMRECADKIIQSGKIPVFAAGTKSYVDYSVGSAFNSGNHIDADEFYKQAELAFVHCKSNIQKDYKIYSDDLAYSAKRQSTLETGLREALETGQLELHYQPLISSDLETIVGVEALARWEHPSIGNIPPSEFIKIAESLGLTSKLGNLVLRKACQALKPVSQIMLAVNISASHFLQPEFLSDLDYILEVTGFEPNRLEIEITESTLVSAIDSARFVIDKLQSRGISVALDDFGTGYSSLSYLNLFNVDRIKIDAEFIKEISSTDKAKSMFSSIFELIKNRGCKITVEGVENIDQVIVLNEFENFWYQGYLFSKPLPYNDLINSDFLKNNKNTEILNLAIVKRPALRVVKSST